MVQLACDDCRSKISKILSITSFALVLFSLYIVAKNPGAEGYEISIYDEYPAYFWYMIIICLLLFQLILFFNIASKANPVFLWRSAYVGIVLTNLILLLIPLIRGYSIYGLGDAISHKGYMLDISQIGHISSNMYPMDHILGVITHQICGFNLDISMSIYPSIFYILGALSFYLLYRIILNYGSSILIAMMLSPLLLASNGNMIFAPNCQANSLLPFLLFLYFSCFIKTNTSYNILITVLIMAITFFHPLTTLFLLVFFCIVELIYILFKRGNWDIYLINNSSKYLILIIFTIYFSWQSYAALLLGTIRKVYAWLYEDSVGVSAVGQYSNLIARVNPDFTHLLTSFVYAYGLPLLFMLTGLFSILILYKAWKDKKYVLNMLFIVLAILFIFFFLFYIASFFTVSGIGFNRSSNYAVFLSLLIIPIAFGYLFEGRKRQKNAFKLVSLFLLLLLCSADYLSVFTLYFSPINRLPGPHLVDSWPIGINTFFETRNEDIPIAEGGISLNRIKEGLYGNSKKLKNVLYLENSSIPDHFAYTNTTYFGDYYENFTYLILTSLFRITYPKLYPEFPDRWRFNQKDFTMLEYDVSVSKVYSNNELDVYLLKPFLQA